MESSPWFNQARYLSNNFGVLPENRLVIDHSDNHAQIEKLVGGKNRQLAWLHQIREQMIKDGIQDPINVPDGSALTGGFFQLITKPLEGKIQEQLNNLQYHFRTLSILEIEELRLNPKEGSKIDYQMVDGEQVAVEKSIDGNSLKKVTFNIRKMIWDEYKNLSPEHREILEIEILRKPGTKAVRSSAIGEDGESESFAGQAESELGVKGLEQTIEAYFKVLASCYTDRIVSYRVSNNLPPSGIMSVVLQNMVESHLPGGSAGVGFSLDPVSGFPKVITIQANPFLGEAVVGSETNPDTYHSTKPNGDLKARVILESKGTKKFGRVYNLGRKSGEPFTIKIELPEELSKQYTLEPEEVERLATWAAYLESLLGPVDFEWAKDGPTQELYIVQIRPETVASQKSANHIVRYELAPLPGQKLNRIKTPNSKELKGNAANDSIGSGKVLVLDSYEEALNHVIDKNTIIVTHQTTPDWEPVMRKAGGIITEVGGITCHAAIIAREIGIATAVGCENAKKILKTGQEITIDNSQSSESIFYEGIVPYNEKHIDVSHLIDDLKNTKTKIQLNMGKPESAFSQVMMAPNHAGSGLIRLEFIVAAIGIHPLCVPHFDLLNAEEQVDVFKKLGIEEYLHLLGQYHTNNNNIDINSNMRVSKQMVLLNKIKSLLEKAYVRKLSLGIATMAKAVDPYIAVVRMGDFKSNEYANLLGGRRFEAKEENPMMGVRGAARYYNPRFKPAFRLECMGVKGAIDILGGEANSNLAVEIPFIRSVEDAELALAELNINGISSQKLENTGFISNNKTISEEDKVKIQKISKVLCPVYAMAEVPGNVFVVEGLCKIFDGFKVGGNDIAQLGHGVDRDGNPILKNIPGTGPESQESLGWVRMFSNEVAKYNQNNSGVSVTMGYCGQAPSNNPSFAKKLIEAGVTSISVDPSSALQVGLEVLKYELEQDNNVSGLIEEVDKVLSQLKA